MSLWRNRARVGYLSGPTARLVDSTNQSGFTHLSKKDAARDDKRRR
jgi:hypothetical protein